MISAAFFDLEPLFAFDLVEDLRVLGEEEVMIECYSIKKWICSEVYEVAATASIIVWFITTRPTVVNI